MANLRVRSIARLSSASAGGGDEHEVRGRLAITKEVHRSPVDAPEYRRAHPRDFIDAAFIVSNLEKRGVQRLQFGESHIKVANNRAADKLRNRVEEGCARRRQLFIAQEEQLAGRSLQPCRDMIAPGDERVRADGQRALGRRYHE